MKTYEGSEVTPTPNTRDYFLLPDYTKTCSQIISSLVGNSIQTMNTKFIISSSAITTGLAGIAFTFLPEEIIQFTRLEQRLEIIALLKIVGALYFSFGIINWMNRSRLIGGIYNKPLATANFSHFFIVAVFMIKGLLFSSTMIYWTITIIYSCYAGLFGIIMLRHPIKETIA